MKSRSNGAKLANRAEDDHDEEVSILAFDFRGPAVAAKRSQPLELLRRQTGLIKNAPERSHADLVLGISSMICLLDFFPHFIH